ncbi:hydroxymethylglutaryl-CoA reductase, degradative [Methanocella sp. CWC-04]|uniref:3-hydroxy-3-methylglutaryl coenzyme A reductase n=1 Tax=Methanooceanicella nereidis TaxID=2052831 RepID=A0AAP2W7B6_9EURY|nr:hydroxymethylglutaryl-CoA reductase, degradative [Methanocella sp. CWC-04]MCD1296248.1 hydroxymethylglutaryl-CoA reductase, degradative [Methanocella sp. CWC-04]
MEKTSKISGFYKIPPLERLNIVKEYAGLSDEDVANISATGALKYDQLDRMVENVIGTIEVPVGVAVNFLINDKDYLIPMATEEPSVIAAASNAAKMVRDNGGFTTSSTGPVMRGLIQVTNVKDPYGARFAVLSEKEKIMEMANAVDPILVKFGGGCKDVEAYVRQAPSEDILVVHLIVDCRDAMGANAVNTMAETVGPYIEKITGGKVYLRIISNLADKRLMRAKAVFTKESIGGEDVVDGVIKAFEFALADPYRTATHNKGIMNGITAVTLATGNDTRAIEAGAHAYAAITGTYRPLTRYEKNANGDLVATIELPLAVGLVGGATASHPTARANVKITGVKTATELGEIMAAVGLAQNFAAMRALATEGIQRGHMQLHSRNVAIQAGATGDLVDKVAEAMVREKKVRADRAKELLEEFKAGKQ